MGNIAEERQKDNDINVQGTIEDKGEPRTVNTKYGETQVCDAFIKDETGRIKLSLWGGDIEKFSNGDTVLVEGAYKTTFRDQDQLNIPKGKGKLEKIS